MAARRQAGLLIPRPLRQPQDVPLPTNTQKSRPARSGELSLLSRARETKPFTARPGTEGTCRVNHSAALCRRCRKSAGVEHLGQLSLREVGEVVAFLAPPPPVTNCQPRARNSVPGIPHWPSGRLMGFLFCRGLKFRPRVQVFREALNHELLPRTATHTLAARVAHTCGRACRLRCAGWIDSRRGVGSAQKSEIFSCGLDRRAVIRPSTTALSLSQCLHVAPRLTRC